MKPVIWTLLACAAVSCLSACGGSSNNIPPADSIKDTRTEEAREADENMEKHFKKFGNR